MLCCLFATSRAVVTRGAKANGRRDFRSLFPWLAASRKDLELASTRDQAIAATDPRALLPNGKIYAGDLRKRIRACPGYSTAMRAGGAPRWSLLARPTVPCETIRSILRLRIL